MVEVGGSTEYDRDKVQNENWPRWEWTKWRTKKTKWKKIITQQLNRPNAVLCIYLPEPFILFCSLFLLYFVLCFVFTVCMWLDRSRRRRWRRRRVKLKLCNNKWCKNKKRTFSGVDICGRMFVDWYLWSPRAYAECAYNVSECVCV